MHVRVKLFATLQTGRFIEEARQLAPGTTVEQLIKDLAIPTGEATLIFVNGRHVETDVRLKEGDTVALFPPIGGG
jgi:sulfur-carrier protein